MTSESGPVVATFSRSTAERMSGIVICTSGVRLPSVRPLPRAAKLAFTNSI